MIYFFGSIYEIIICTANVIDCLHICIAAFSPYYCSIGLIEINIISPAQTISKNENSPIFDVICSKCLFSTLRNVVFIITVCEDIFRRFPASIYSPDNSALFKKRSFSASITVLESSHVGRA